MPTRRIRPTTRTTRAGVVAGVPQRAGELGQPVGVVARPEAPAALEHAHAEPVLGHRQAAIPPPKPEPTTMAS